MKQRIDILMVEKGLSASRERAKKLIEAGKVFVSGHEIKKASVLIPEDADILITGDDIPFVSRGGCKLLKALEQFDISIEGLTCADIGASTGGFTDCMLQHGASYVYAVDSGHDQLDASLRERKDVMNLEGVNARSITRDMFDRQIHFFACDVSFISLTKVLPSLISVIDEGDCCVCLIKPQFEAGPGFVGKKGVVRDRKVHKRILDDMISFVNSLGFCILGLTYSPIKGPQGNIEYLIYMKREALCEAQRINTSSLVDEAFKLL